jgi:hypothetical protein
MTGKTSPSLPYFQFSEAWLPASRASLPPTQMFEQMSEAARIVTQAQMAFGEAMMRANAAMFAAFLPQGNAPAREIGPSEAARQPEYATP